MIVVASVFRNSESYIPRYVAQIAALRASTHYPVHVIAVEGDSSDETYKALLGAQGIDTVLHAEHGGLSYPSIVHPQRWRQLSTVGNIALCAATRICTEPTDQFIYVESDLVWDPPTMNQLLFDLHTVPAVAPMSMQGARFYDIWGHVKDGRGFSAHPPFYNGWFPGTTVLSEIDSAGSCFATTAEALATLEFSAIDCIRGIGRSLHANGYALHIDPTVHVEHPLDDSR